MQGPNCKYEINTVSVINGANPVILYYYIFKLWFGSERQFT
jgi:hypothetical protein